MDFKAFRNLGMKEKFNCREEFLKKPELLDDYLGSNLEKLETEKIEILEGFKKRISGDFVVLKYLRDYAAFVDLEKSKVYLVKALGDKFKEMISIIRHQSWLKSHLEGCSASRYFFNPRLRFVPMGT